MDLYKIFKGSHVTDRMNELLRREELDDWYLDQDGEIANTRLPYVVVSPSPTQRALMSVGNDQEARNAILENADDAQNYYETFGVPKEEQAKFVFRPYENKTSHWNDYDGSVPVAYWRDEDMPENFGRGIASTSEDQEKRVSILKKAQENDKTLYDNAQYSWNNFNLLKRAFETKYPGLELTLNSGYRHDTPDSEHYTGQAFDAQVKGYADKYDSHTLNIGLLEPVVNDILDNTMHQYIDETSGNGYWSHISTVQPTQKPTKHVDRKARKMYNYDTTERLENGHIPWTKEEDLIRPTQEDIDEAVRRLYGREEKKRNKGLRRRRK